MDQETRDILENYEKRLVRIESILGTDKVDQKSAKVTGKKSILDWFEIFKSEGFFDEPRFTQDLILKFSEKGFHYPRESLTAPLQRAVRKGILGRIKKDDKWAYVKR